MAANDQQELQNSGTGVESQLARHGGLSYLEIPATDVRRSANFYENVLGWCVEARDTDDLRFRDQSGHLIGRWVTCRPISGEPGLLPYFYVDHINEAVKQAVALAGAIVRGIYPEGNLWVATVRDPAGNEIGLWQEAHL
jgi:uncharacterized protein